MEKRWILALIYKTSVPVIVNAFSVFRPTAYSLPPKADPPPAVARAMAGKLAENPYSLGVPTGRQ